MAKKLRVCRAVFDSLLSAVKGEFDRSASLSGHAPKGVGAAYFGFGSGFDYRESNEPSLMKNLVSTLKKIAESKDSKLTSLNTYVLKEGIYSKIKVLSPKYLYNLNREFRKLEKFDSLITDSQILDALAIYVGSTSFEEFVNEDPSISEKVRDIQLKIKDFKEKDLSEKELAYRYIGFYYSFRDRRRKTVEWVVNFYNKSAKGYRCRLTGLHKEESENVDTIYEGFIEDKPTCSYVYLSDTKSDRPFTMIGYRGHVLTRDLNFISYTASGVSQFGHPFSFEVMFVRVDFDRTNVAFEELVQKFDKIEYIDYYLQAQRRNFRIPTRVIKNISSIRARGTRAEVVQIIIGRYRMLSIAHNGDLVQSKYVINADFSSDLYTANLNETYQKQTCMISFSHLGDKLCVSSHVQQGVSVINYAIFDIDFAGDGKPLSGVYCGIVPNGQNFIAQPLVVVKDNAEFNAKRIPIEAIDEYISNASHLKKALLNLLLSDQDVKYRENYLKLIKKLKQKLEEA